MASRAREASRQMASAVAMVRCHTGVALLGYSVSASRRELQSQVKTQIGLSAIYSYSLNFGSLVDLSKSSKGDKIIEEGQHGLLSGLWLACP